MNNLLKDCSNPVDILKLKQHEIAKFVPAANEDDYKALELSCIENGILHPITLFEGFILDGMTRYRIYVSNQKVFLNGRVPKFQEFTGNTIEALEFCAQQNIHRRHLNPSQKAVAAIPFKKKMKEILLKGRQQNQLNKTGKINNGNKIIGKTFGVSDKIIEEAWRISKEHPNRLQEITTGKNTVSNLYKQLYPHLVRAQTKSVRIPTAFNLKRLKMIDSEHVNLDSKIKEEIEATCKQYSNVDWPCKFHMSYDEQVGYRCEFFFGKEKQLSSLVGYSDLSKAISEAKNKIIIMLTKK